MLPLALRIALAVFVTAWILGVHDLRSTIPVWVAFVIALGLEINFFLGALTRPPAPRPDRGPQPVDRELYGYLGWPEEDDEEEDEETTTSTGRTRAAGPPCGGSSGAWGSSRRSR